MGNDFGAGASALRHGRQGRGQFSDFGIGALAEALTVVERQLVRRHPPGLDRVEQRQRPLVPAEEEVDQVRSRGGGGLGPVPEQAGRDLGGLLPPERFDRGGTEICAAPAGGEVAEQAQLVLGQPAPPEDAHRRLAGVGRGRILAGDASGGLAEARQPRVIDWPGRPVQRVQQSCGRCKLLGARFRVVTRQDCGQRLLDEGGLLRRGRGRDQWGQPVRPPRASGRRGCYGRQKPRAVMPGGAEDGDTHLRVVQARRRKPRQRLARARVVPLAEREG